MNSRIIRGTEDGKSQHSNRRAIGLCKDKTLVLMIRNFLIILLFMKFFRPLYAFTGDLQHVSTTLDQLKDAIDPILNSLALLMAAVALGFRVLSKNENRAEAGTTWAIRIICTWGAIQILPWIFKFVGNLLSSLVP